MADKDEDKDNSPAEKTKGGGKKLLILGLLLGLLLGGGAAAFFLLSGGDASEKSAEEVVVKDQKPKIDAQFVKVERMNIPLVSKGRVLGNLTVDFSMEVDGNENKLLVVRNLPEIRDAMLRHFSEESIGKPDNPRSVDYPRLKETLKDISNRILHDPLILRVMVVQVRQS